MAFWNTEINVSREAAQQQIDIISTFPPEKRFKIAIDFATLGIQRTREWIKQSMPNASELEVTLEFVRLMYVETGEMDKETWFFYKNEMTKKIKKDWIARFRKMMNENHWNYNDIAQMGHFKNGKVVQATISRGLPSFAKLLICVYEKQKEETRSNLK